MTEQIVSEQIISERIIAFHLFSDRQAVTRDRPQLHPVLFL